MKRPRITKRVLDGIISATSIYLAGPPDNGSTSGPEYDAQLRDEEDVGLADSWAHDMRDWLARPQRPRPQRPRPRKSSTPSLDKPLKRLVHVAHPTDIDRLMCGRERLIDCVGERKCVAWDESSLTIHATVTCKSCLAAYNAERQKENERAAKADAKYRAQYDDDEGGEGVNDA